MESCSAFSPALLPPYFAAASELHDNPMKDVPLTLLCCSEDIRAAAKEAFLRSSDTGLALRDMVRQSPLCASSILNEVGLGQISERFQSNSHFLEQLFRQRTFLQSCILQIENHLRIFVNRCCPNDVAATEAVEMLMRLQDSGGSDGDPGVTRHNSRAKTMPPPSTSLHQLFAAAKLGPKSSALLFAAAGAAGDNYIAADLSDDGGDDHEWYSVGSAVPQLVDDCSPTLRRKKKREANAKSSTNFRCSDMSSEVMMFPTDQFLWECNNNIRDKPTCLDKFDDRHSCKAMTQTLPASSFLPDMTLSLQNLAASVYPQLLTTARHSAGLDTDSTALPTATVCSSPSSPASLTPPYIAQQAALQQTVLKQSVVEPLVSPRSFSPNVRFSPLPLESQSPSREPGAAHCALSATLSPSKRFLSGRGMMSLNSVEAHHAGNCKPCAFYYSPRAACKAEGQCGFCHHEDHSAVHIKRWKKLQRNLKTAAAATAPGTASLLPVATGAKIAV